MRERKSDDADLAVRPPRGLPAVLREDHPDGGEPAATAAALRHLPREDPAAATGTAARHQQELAGSSS